MDYPYYKEITLIFHLNGIEKLELNFASHCYLIQLPLIFLKYFSMFYHSLQGIMIEDLVKI
jgi:hypothetical protein